MRVLHYTSLLALLSALIYYFRLFTLNLQKNYLIMTGKFPKLTENLTEQDLIEINISIELATYLVGCLIAAILINSLPSKYLKWFLNGVMFLGGLLALVTFVIFLN